MSIDIRNEPFRDEKKNQQSFTLFTIPSHESDVATTTKKKSSLIFFGTGIFLVTNNLSNDVANKTLRVH